MKRYTVYLGCMIPMRFPSIELSARLVFEALGAELVDLEGYTCCPDPVLSRLAESDFSLALSARNLALASKLGNDLLVLCNGCYETLVEAEEQLRENAEARKKINLILKEHGLEYDGGVRIRAFMDLLNEDFGIEKISQQVKLRKELKVAAHTGCHMLRSGQHPRERIKLLDNLIKPTGASAVNYGKEMLCCGFPASTADENFALENVIKPKFEAIMSAKAEAIVTGCPTCLYQLEASQLALAKCNINCGMPVLHLLELLALSFGNRPDKLGLETHRGTAREFALKKWGDSQ
jgi:heterodisulfide reductase subunit B